MAVKVSNEFAATSGSFGNKIIYEIKKVYQCCLSGGVLIDSEIAISLSVIYRMAFAKQASRTISTAGTRRWAPSLEERQPAKKDGS